MSDTDKKVASQKIADLLKSIEKATAEAVALADEHGMEFSFPAPTYGTGCWYTGKGHPDRSETNQYGDENDGWYASSQGC